VKIESRLPIPTDRFRLGVDRSKSGGRGSRVRGTAECRAGRNVSKRCAAQTVAGLINTARVSRAFTGMRGPDHY
jgi:hypothetical protein